MPQARITSQYVDSMMAARRVNDDHMQSLDGYTKETTRLGIAAKAEMDIVTRRRASNMARVQSEMKTQDIIETADIDAKNEERIHDQNGKLAKELERRRAEHERKEREIQRICEESEELKELERRLKVAYMNKERSAQHEERLLVDSIEMQRNQAIEDQMEFDRREALKAEAQQAEARRVVGLHQKAALQQQIEARDVLLEEAKAEAEKDKEMVDSVVARIAAEDDREIFERTRRKDETRMLIKDYERQRKRELEDKRMREAEEEAKIRAHMQAMAAREETVARLKAAKKEAEQAAFDKIVEETERARADEEEMQRLRDMLWEEEMEAARLREERAAALGAKPGHFERTNVKKVVSERQAVTIVVKDDQDDGLAELVTPQSRVTIVKQASDRGVVKIGRAHV